MTRRSGASPEPGPIPDDAPDTALETAAVDVVLRRRHTAKLLGDPASAGDDGPLPEAERATLERMIELAGWAPFHHRAHASHREGSLDSVVPWRFHVLERDACRRLVDVLTSRAADDPDPKWARAAGSKIPALLAAASALVQVTWLPEPIGDDAPPGPGDRDVEHVAAASAAVQNLLLAAEARRWRAYWSSGGVLRDPDVFSLLGIPVGERLLGSIFLTSPDGAFDRNVPGGLRDERGGPDGWRRHVTLA